MPSYEQLKASFDAYVAEVICDDADRFAFRSKNGPIFYLMFDEATNLFDLGFVLDGAAVSDIPAQVFPRLIEVLPQADPRVAWGFMVAAGGDGGDAADFRLHTYIEAGTPLWRCHERFAAFATTVHRYLLHLRPFLRDQLVQNDYNADPTRQRDPTSYIS